jgi:hypothetical protein
MFQVAQRSQAIVTIANSVLVDFNYSRGKSVRGNALLYVSVGTGVSRIILMSYLSRVEVVVEVLDNGRPGVNVLKLFIFVTDGEAK